jgi:hypothetical protein
MGADGWRAISDRAATLATGPAAKSAPAWTCSNAAGWRINDAVNPFP